MEHFRDKIAMISIEKLTKDSLGKAGELADSVFPTAKVPPSMGLKASLDDTVLQDLNDNHAGKFNWLKYWVAVDDKTQKIIGVIGVYEEWEDSEEACWLGWYGVDPEYRGKGIGSQLLDFAITKARNRNKQYLRLYTSTEENEKAAQSIYEKYGFRVMRGRPREKKDNYEIFYRELALRAKNVTLHKKALILPVNRKNEILIQDRSTLKRKIKMLWGYFGGTIESGETPLQAVIRETEEELGILLKPSQLRYIGRFDDWATEKDKVERDIFLWFMGNTQLGELTLQEGKAMVFKTITETSQLMVLAMDKRSPLVVQGYIQGYYSIKLANPKNELLDVLIEGNLESDKTLLFVHGLGTDKHEGSGLFDDLSKAFSKTHRIVRFDFASFGASEGKEEDNNYQKNSQDLETVIDFIKSEFGGKLYLLAHSMGTFAVGKLCPDNFEKIVLTGIPNSNTEHIINIFTKRISSREGSKIDYDGISTYPRSSGTVQKIGADFWRELRAFNPIAAFTKLAKKTGLTIIHPKQDEVVGNKYMEAYETISGVTYFELEGNHSWVKQKDREKLISKVKEIL
jgi:ribosomal protein S18 acetylase RimI-like enzyme/pimeloyl-ACP methyl ester carboxylesterase